MEQSVNRSFGPMEHSANRSLDLMEHSENRYFGPMEHSANSSLDLNLLPYPVQVPIIKNMKSADDILSLRRAFPGGSIESTANASRGDWLFEKVFPCLLPYLSVKQTLKCRGVSQRWKRTIDTTLEKVGLEEPDYSEPLDDIHMARWIGDWTVRPFWWKLPEPELPHFTREMGAYSSNPFPFRALSFGVLDNPISVENVKRFLQRFGHHCWKLRILILCPAHIAACVVRDLLVWTPNLRMLQVEMDHLPGLTALEKRLFEHRLTLYGFPALPHLTHLDWLFGYSFYRFAMPLYSETLVELKVPHSRRGTFMEVYDSRFHGTFPNLKLLEVWIDDEEELNKLTQMESPLKNLMTVCAFRIPLSHHLDVYRHFGQTLECVTIDFDTELGTDIRNLEYFKYGEDDTVWEMPELVTVSLKNPNPEESLDVLLAIQPGLKTLHLVSTVDANTGELTMDNPERFWNEMEGESIQIHGYLNRMYESAIWDGMPSLETLKLKMIDQLEDPVHENVYTRAEMQEMVNPNKRRRLN